MWDVACNSCLHACSPAGIGSLGAHSARMKRHPAFQFLHVPRLCLSRALSTDCRREAAPGGARAPAGGAGAGELVLITIGGKVAMIGNGCRVCCSICSLYCSCTLPPLFPHLGAHFCAFHTIPSINPQEHKAVVAEGLEMVEFQAGQAIFEQGEAGDKFYIIREGTGGWLCFCNAQKF